MVDREAEEAAAHLLGGVKPPLFTKTTGLFIIPAWLLGMGWLVGHDVWPRWTAQEPPRLAVETWLEEPNRQAQFAMFIDGQRMGTIWTDYTGDERSVQRHDLIWIERFPLDIAPLRLHVDSTFTAEGVLDEFHLRLTDPSLIPTELHGERFHSDFSFTFERGSMERTFKLPLTDGGMITGSFSPFTRLENIHVGQTWRVQVFNPICALTGLGNRFTSMLVKVTGEDTIESDGKWVTCLVIESRNAKIWVDPSGAVLAQEMTVPVLGKLRIVREANYDAQAKATARKFSFGHLRRESTP